MTFDATSELLIRRYLLAAVSDEERDQVETRILVDDDFFTHIDLVEDELIEEYLDQELDPADRKRFEDTFLCAPERQDKLRFASALRLYATRLAGSGQAQVDDEGGRRWNPIAFLFEWPRPVLAHVLVSTLVVLAGGGLWTAREMSGFRTQISELRIQQESSEATVARLRTVIEAEQARADQAAGRLQEERREGRATQLAMSAQPWFTLTAGIQRSGESVSRVEIPKDALLVGLRLDLPENPGAAYRAVLLTGGREILSRSQLKAAASDSEITVSFSVPAADLPDGYCEIRLFAGDEREPFEVFHFRVTRN